MTTYLHISDNGRTISVVGGGYGTNSNVGIYSNEVAGGTIQGANIIEETICNKTGTEMTTPMHISANGRALIEAFEGLEKAIHGKPGYVTTYYDSVHVLTIGYGHTNLGGVPPHIKPGDVWSHAEADAALAADMERFERDVLKAMRGVELNQNEFDALVSFDFNTGSLFRSSIDDQIRAGHKQAAMDTLLRYNHAGGMVLAGLTRRRQAERALFEGHVDYALKLAGAHQKKGDPMAKALPAPQGNPNA